MSEVTYLNPNKNESSLEIISFFAGAGFLDLGFESEGYEVSYVNEIHEPFVEAYKHAREHMGIKEPKYGFHQKSIEDFLEEDQKQFLKTIVKNAHDNNKVIGFIGGPPCPDFSVGGKNRGHKGDNGKLSGTYIDIIIDQQPDFFVFENVKGLWRTKKHREFYDSLKIKLEKAGYLLSDKLINAISYGAPQDRERIILFGVLKKGMLQDKDIASFDWDKFALYPDRSAFEFTWPDTNTFSKNSKKSQPKNIPEELTVEYWFRRNDVSNHPNGNDSFKPRAGLAKFKTIAEGDDKKKSYKRLHRWRYSPTACYGNNEVHLHPYKERRISAAEALALQSLPKDFILPETMSLTNMFKTIGNGVPYLAALSLAKTIKDFIQKDANDESDRSKYSERCKQAS